MNDKQQIEEIAQDIEFAINNECKLNNGKSCEDCQFDNMGDWKCQNTMMATYLYGENYRKIPENTVVLTLEELLEITSKAMKLGKLKARKEMAREISKTIKEEIFSILSSKKTGFVNKEEVEFCSTMAKQILYQINKHLNEDYGFDMPLFAENQFLAETELAKQYGVEVKE